MDRPYVVCHMLASLDGKIDGAFMSAPENRLMGAEYGRLRTVFDCQATIYGTTTMAGSYAEGLAPELPACGEVYPREDYAAPTDTANYIVSADPAGTLGWASKYIEKKGRPKAHVIEVLTEQVSDDYLAYLRSFDISYIFAGKEGLDCTLALQKLKNLFRIDRLMAAGGGLMNASLLQDGLIDELSLVLSPLVDGGRAASIFDRAAFLPGRGPAAFTLQNVERLEGSGLWLRYKVIPE